MHFYPNPTPNRAAAVLPTPITCSVPSLGYTAPSACIPPHTPSPIQRQTVTIFPPSISPPLPTHWLAYHRQALRTYARMQDLRVSKMRKKPNYTMEFQSDDHATFTRYEVKTDAALSVRKLLGKETNKWAGSHPKCGKTACG
ncbi:hypothetical protein BU23DRAFT_225455 [Bimuria novae-zelandiae CBS 107.79]|uniref:Uncharacterized protein n=1 Tax=Bimuria novae-zelandiae CBS 107.79 TaxID=1447943 RepID=A0A6A5VPI5_9PLEO|nr:hypothetical protein BU23DRAFT_225455 [Bimuria novae-zelandiae CBS 107.79]